ncbi:DUF433 domain-containing protein [Hymenobacter sp. BT523]|uniref:DUF433 domain-containing protein n=1 Tax=Hymenobacter sp. BT523 TaxID=2795725 RepID=UPI0018EBDE6D|nr:DUF433 domain-containing protein [Hymenobacter sp. BT523]MBJ6107920.1 DUF433 domain-containing protein [Hymenobacter sp. BT523]
MKFPVFPRITIHPSICNGQPTVRGLRYPVWQVLEWLASGATEAELLAAHPALEPEDFRACLAFAAERLKPHDRTPPTAEDQTSEEWILSRQSRWLAEQEFLKQLWERSPGPSAKGNVEGPHSPK